MTEVARAAGALLGLAVGDAFGATVEFTRPVGLPSYPQLVTGPHVDVTGGGPHGVARGQVTDDTQMATCLAEALRERGADTTVHDIAPRYVAWRKHAFDIGSQTRHAIDCLIDGAPPSESGRAVWLMRRRQPAGNGSLMRTAPIGVCFAHDHASRCLMSVFDSMITHYDPRCALACAAFNGAIAAAVRGETALRDMLGWARDDLAQVSTYFARTHMAESAALVREAEALLVTDLQAALEPDPGLYQPGLHLLDDAGFVRVAFRLAFWHLVHATSVPAALVDVVNRGGDADTNAAIVGALIGARFGADAIPLRWTEAVLGALPAQGKDSLLATRYHPVMLVGDVDALLAAGRPRGQPSV